ncbi:class I SAM-dependent methyltransferase [Nocardiopsis sp. HNM0947]|uniref:Class I SAM-dependent methyltransferase n=1 Tax=Nocardiopsis coralli TaxID=2772213 RepID=A0ABR9PAA6_9ACTN|nr:class I SAM-dependent methyltransferase [Nocardiopsis coralli]MBE3000775.1 class I SAM-dependent methyltransferase [Nocardiopsis coralli]
MSRATRWFSETKDGHSQWYIDRFRRMAAEGADLAGEARFVDTMLPRAARVLDAGCGSGRISGELHRRGHQVVGVDVDPVLIEASAQDHPGPTYAVADLAELDLPGHGIEGPFDAAVLAGNVMCFVAPGSETDVLSSVARHIKADGFVVAGFGLDRTLTLAEFDEHAAAAGLEVEHRFATWDLKPWSEGAGFAVTVLRHRA